MKNTRLSRKIPPIAKGQSFRKYHPEVIKLLKITLSIPVSKEYIEYAKKAIDKTPYPD
jgi:hypothetical protein